MARPLDHTPSAAPTETSARSELEALLETLHSSGALRVLRGVFGAGPQLLEVALSQLETAGGKNALGNVAVAITSLTKLDADRVHALVEALNEAVRAAAASVQRPPPGLMGLFAMLMREDTRRGLHALVVMLSALGRELDDSGDEAQTLTPVRA